MAFLAPIAEGASFIGSFVTEETGSAVLGGAAAGKFVEKSGQVLESGASAFVNGIFGEGTFENLEAHVNELYTNVSNLTGDLIQVRNAVEAGQSPKEQLDKLQKDKEIFNNGKIVQGVSEFVKDLSHLVSQGDYNSLDNVSDIIIENNTKTVSNVLNSLSKINPFYSYLVSKFVGKIADFVVPNDEEYQKVASIYNGEGLGPMIVESNYGNYEFSVTDEVGKKSIWKYPEYNNYTVVRPIFGVYTGINSPNNAMLLNGTLNGTKVESFLDKIAFLHDVGYHDLGSFNKFSDYQLISRGAYGKQNNLYIFPNELAVANVAISYFSTLGKLMRKMFGDDSNVSVQLPSNVSQEPPLIKEIFNEIHKVDIDDSVVSDLKKQTVQVIKNSDKQYGSEIVGNSNFSLRNAINNLELELN